MAMSTTFYVCGLQGRTLTDRNLLDDRVSALVPPQKDAATHQDENETLAMGLDQELDFAQSDQAASSGNAARAMPTQRRVLRVPTKPLCRCAKRLR